MLREQTIRLEPSPRKEKHQPILMAGRTELSRSCCLDFEIQSKVRNIQQKSPLCKVQPTISTRSLSLLHTNNHAKRNFFERFMPSAHAFIQLWKGTDTDKGKY